MRFFALAVLLLAGCDGTAPAPDAAPAADATAFCDGVAARDPAVKALVLRGLSNTAFFADAPAQIAAAKAVARAECLKRQGVLPGGGGVQATYQ